MRHILYIAFLFYCMPLFSQNTDEKTKASEDSRLQIPTNSAIPVYTPELGGTYQWNYENQTHYEGSLDMIYNQYFWLNNSLKSQGQNISQLQTNSELNGLIATSNKTYPNTFENNFLQYVHNGKNVQNGEFLLNAYNLDPGRVEIFDELLEYAEWKNNELLLSEVANKIKASEKYDNVTYDYSDMLLRTLPQNSYLITSGELETVTGKVLQLVDGKHRSITIIRKEWLEEGKYTEARLKELGLGWSDVNDDLQPQIQKLITSNSSKTFYLSLTLPLQEFEYMANSLYLIGLVYKYSETSVNNMSEILKNWEELYMQVNLENYKKSTWGRKLISNYLLSGIKLYKYFLDSGDNRKANKLKDKLLQIGELCNNKERVKAML